MKLVLFCDYGLDDAAATVDALAHSIEDGYDEVVLVAIGGNVPPSISLRNVIRLVSNCDFKYAPVTVIDTTAEEQPFEFLTTVHGGDGMGDLFQDKPFHAKILTFREWLEGFSDDYLLLSLGPMTLVPELLKKRAPEKFVFMGGNIAEEPNFQGYEFNHALDREAFSEAVKYPHFAVTMDTCRNPFLNIQSERIEADSLLSRIVARARDLTLMSGEKGCYLWDDIALKYLRHPNWFTLRYGVDRDGNELTYAEYIHGDKYLRLLEL
ncbi:MAG: nucleoside hydrolase [Clostridia bacterium]|nr:nucleoside hydrolase [Clostridia bacterium]